MKAVISSILIFGATFTVFSNTSTFKISKTDYIEMWKETAVQNMIQYGIPASITLAQGILESSFGNSDLAIEANNHFGIKCHNWTGKKYFQDDDTKDECFRKYSNARESYQDHSLFLTTNTRYDFLFDLSKTDYESWAKGLKKAGYATNPQYANLLIEAIENNKLDELDKIGGNGYSDQTLASTTKHSKLDIPTTVISTASTHSLKINENKVRYIIVKKGDTFYRIAQEFELGLWQLYKYNDFDKHKDVLEVGDIVYIQPKRSKAKGKHHVSMKTTQESTIIGISQLEGIRVKSLMKMNDIASADDKIPSGSTVILK